MAAYYNEIDPYCAQWLRNLIAKKLIAPGDVDERSITDVQPDDVRGYDQCHFFAGIGGWSLALRLAGVADDYPVWTGSCPCQPLSGAGLRKGHADERHLWPAFHRLIAECAPAMVFGEQVASKDGREWLAGVRADLERLGYACGGADLCAAGLGAPHIRQRVYWVADRLADRDAERLQERALPVRQGAAGRRAGEVPDASGSGDHDAGRQGDRPELSQRGAEQLPAESSAWSGAIWIPCADGKARRIEPSIEPLAHGVPARVGRLRAYGNAIVPQVAAEFVRAAL